MTEADITDRVTVFETPSGDRMVVLPFDAYQDLIDAADVASAERVLRDITQGHSEWVPAAVVDRLLDGENPIRVWREHRGLSAKELAEKAGVSAAYLSEVETGKKAGSIAMLKAIAAALDVDLDDVA